VDPHEVSSTLVHVHRPNRWGSSNSAHRWFRRLACNISRGGLLSRFAQPSIKRALAREKIAAHFRIAYLTKSGNL
jgi:hypothetical protein